MVGKWTGSRLDRVSCFGLNKTFPPVSEVLEHARSVNKIEQAEDKERMIVRFDEEDPSGAPVSVRDRDDESFAFMSALQTRSSQGGKHRVGS